MSNEKANKKVAESGKTTVSTAKTIKKETEFPLYELREHSRELFGVKPEVFDGAFLNYKNGQATKKQAENLVKSFLNKEVK
ncbi:hypothetical protein [Gracilibacillus alcaliphilus]|uniref:hypothetical protein n=1 Tax=Gracilibacillus alcaliphilus TaxID=1401441 RepID=UPI00195660C4|nr:hypothetical protein [Gracilibacillus alcaliphilus]